MPFATIVVPAYNVTATLRETLDSLCAQTHPDFEIIVVDDGSTDGSAEMARAYGDSRIRVISQKNRGLAGARNTGIAAARGSYIGFCDADDLWRPTKLCEHIRHLEDNPTVGISFSGSELIDEAGRSMGMTQRPRLRRISAAHMFRRNPIGNGSAAVIRRAAFESIAYRPSGETERDWYFDETFRQSEDIECWLRLMLSADWEIAGISGALTRYRIASGGLSAGTERQYAAWDRMVYKLTPLAPEFFAKHTPAARAYQFRYLARRAITARDAERAVLFMRAAMRSSLRPLFEEPRKTVITLAATLVLKLAGPAAIDALLSRRTFL